MKKNILAILFLSIIISFISCKKQESDVVVLKTIDFKTGLIDVHASNIGTYFDKTQNKDLVYIIDRSNCVKRFYLTGELYDTVSLAKTNNFLRGKQDKIASIKVYSQDSILVLSDYKYWFLLINEKGKIINSTWLNDILPDSLSSAIGVYEAGNSISNSNSDYNNLFYTFQFSDEYYSKYIVGLDTLDLFQHVLQKSMVLRSSPWLINIKNLYSDNKNDIEVAFIADDYALRFFEIGDFVSISRNFRIIKDELFFLPSYNDTNIISSYSIDTHEHLRDVKIESKHTKVGFNITIEEQAYGTTKTEFVGLIYYVFFHKKENNYYVVLSHFIDEDDQKLVQEKQQRSEPFSVIKYDENFENPKEYKFEAGTYIPRNSCMTSEGLIIQRKPENLKKDNFGVQSFDLFKFN
ncbi:MAG: hypothetical protein GX879_01420 [Bacteroidales bacterium]|nr:hypothetical protein [Bacteroidales bacterium]